MAIISSKGKSASIQCYLLFLACVIFVSTFKVAAQQISSSTDSLTSQPTSIDTAFSIISTTAPATTTTTTSTLTVATSTATPPSSSSASSKPTTTPNPSIILISYANATAQDTLFNKTYNATMFIKYNIYSPDMGTDIALRSSAITLTLCCGFIFVMGFARRNLVAWLVSITLFGHAFAVWAGSIPFLRIVPSPNIYWTNFVSVTLLCFTSETFLWCLYFRFTAVVAMRSPWLKYFTLTWLAANSTMVFVNTMFWNYFAYMGDAAGKARCATNYSYMNFVQASIAAFLSGYFFIIYYIPKLKGLSTWLMCVKLYSTGLVYLFGEVTLHMMYFVAFKSSTTQPFYTGLSAFATSFRLALFVLFLFKMKDTLIAAERDRESQRNKTHPSASNPGMSYQSSHSDPNAIRRVPSQPEIIAYKDPNTTTTNSTINNTSEFDDTPRRLHEAVIPMQPLLTSSAPALASKRSNQILAYSYDTNNSATTTHDQQQQPLVIGTPGSTIAPLKAKDSTSSRSSKTPLLPSVSPATDFSMSSSSIATTVINNNNNNNNTFLLYQGQQQLPRATPTSTIHPSWNTLTSLHRSVSESHRSNSSVAMLQRAQTISEPMPIHTSSFLPPQQPPLGTSGVIPLPKRSGSFSHPGSSY